MQRLEAIMEEKKDSSNWKVVRNILLLWGTPVLLVLLKWFTGW